MSVLSLHARLLGVNSSPDLLNDFIASLQRPVLPSISRESSGLGARRGSSSTLLGPVRVRCLVPVPLLPSRFSRSNSPHNASRLFILSYCRLQFVGTKCPAALIAPNVAVTAASCFCDYGGPTQFTEAKFCSGAFDGSAYFESEVSSVFPSVPYCQGTDTCSTNGSLRKCANNLAVVSLLNINTPASLATLAPGVVSPYYNIEDCPYSFTNGFISGSLTAQITALGYASNLNNGERMMRTDSLGQLQTPNQLYIGSSMRENSQGSPMMVNFGLSMANSLPAGIDGQPNTVVGVVSWFSAQASTGASSYLVGGSCFGKNAEYTQYSNIITLVNTFCCTLNQEQRAAQCGGDNNASTIRFHRHLRRRPQ